MELKRREKVNIIIVMKENREISGELNRNQVFQIHLIDVSENSRKTEEKGAIFLKNGTLTNNSRKFTVTGGKR